MSKITKLFNKKINKKKTLFDTLLTEEGSYAAVSVGDLFYDYIRGNPEVIKTIDIIHPNESLSNPIEVGWFKKQRMEFFEKNSKNPELSWSGHENRDLGYYGERYFGQKFQSQGSEVEYPVSLNNPGFDFKVNGIPFQSKVGSSQLLDQYFKKYPVEQYPDYRVIANSEAVQDYISRHPEHASKIADGGPINEIKENYFESSNATREIFEDQNLFSIPVAESISIGVLIATVRNTYKFIQNKKSFGEALGDTGIDAAGMVGSISLFGGAGSLIIGTLSGPYGYIAGKLVGGIFGVYSGKKISTGIKHFVRCESEEAQLEKAIKNYLLKISSILKNNNKIIEEKQKNLEDYLSKRNEISKEVWTYVNSRIENEKNYRKMIDSKIKHSIKDVFFLDQEATYMSNLVDEAIFLGNKIGIGPLFLEKESKELIEASKKYKKCIEKII